MWLALISVVILAFLLHKLLLSTGKKPSWWAKHGVQEIDASEVATPLEILLGSKNITDRDDYVYEQMGSQKFVGVMEKPCPIILVKDLNLAKKIFIKDFDHFVDRRDFFTVADEKSTIAKMLGLLKGDKWKGLRTTMSPTFTTGKIRRMMEHFNSVGKDWTDGLKEKAQEGSLSTDMLTVVNQFTIDVIGKAVFGIDTGTAKDPSTVFAKKAYLISEPSWFQSIKQNLSPRYPSVFKFFGIEPLDMEGMDFFEGIVRQGLEQKLKGISTRDDFQQLLLEARKGSVKAVGSDELDAFEKDAQLKNDQKQSITDEVIVAQSLLFFIAGFTGVSGFITFMSYVLAVNQEVQDKLREEVDGIVKDDGTLDYDDLGKLVYLDMVASETLRKYPLATRLERECLRDYHDPESGLTIPKDTVVVIPVNALHHDNEHYPNADKFDPEHFSAEGKAKRNNYAYLPFGAGPRNCIGMRFALVESKAAIAYLVHNFRIEPTEKTPIPVEIRKIGMQINPPQNLQLKLTPI